MCYYSLIQAKAKLRILQEDINLFGATPEDIQNMNALRVLIRELTANKK